MASNLRAVACLVWCWRQRYVLSVLLSLVLGVLAVHVLSVLALDVLSSTF